MTILTPKSRAKKIVGMGGQILLPHDVRDVEVTFMRWELTRLIEEAIEEAECEAREEVYNDFSW